MNSLRLIGQYAAVENFAAKRRGSDKRRNYLWRKSAAKPGKCRVFRGEAAAKLLQP